MKRLSQIKYIDIQLSLLGMVCFFLSIKMLTGAPQLFLLGISFVLILLWLAVMFINIHGDLKSYYSRKLEGTIKPEKPHNELQIAVRLLKIFLPSDDYQQNIIGDLLEEFSELESKAAAYIWLYKQVLKSVLPLAYKNVISRLASYFGERTR